MRRALLTLALLFTGTTSAIPQDIPQKFSMQGSFGTVTMDGVQWQRFSFRPDIPIGKFGIGLDLELFLNEKGEFSREGWDFSTRNRTWDTVLRKIYYVRWGNQFDPVYFRAGSLDEVTLGYGLIMDGYTNALNYPAEKNTGIDISIQNVGTFGIGVRAMANSLGDLKNDGIIAGGRVSARPLRMLSAPLASAVTIGFTLVRDANQFAGLKDSDADGYPDFQDGWPDDAEKWEDSDGDGFEDAVDIDIDGDNVLDTEDPEVALRDYLNIRRNRNGVTAAGFDVALPLIEDPVQLDIYGQYARLQPGDDDLETGWGIGAPGIRLIAGPFLTQAEYRHFGGRFVSGYFDNLYDHERVQLVGNAIIRKEMNIPDGSLDGFYGRMGYQLVDFVYAHAGYQYMTGDKTYQDISGVVRLLPGLLDMVPKLTVMEAYFYNRHVESGAYSLFEFTPNTLYGTRVGLSLGTGMSVVWSTRYTFTPKTGLGGLEKQRFISIETVVMMN